MLILKIALIYSILSFPYIVVKPHTQPFVFAEKRIGDMPGEYAERLRKEEQEKQDHELEAFQKKLTGFFRLQQRKLRETAKHKNNSDSNPPVRPVSPTTGNPLELFKAYLKQVYSQKKMCRTYFEELSLDRNHEPRERSLSLVLVDENNSTTPIEMSDIDKNIENNPKVLVEGIAGVGKSTFAWEMCQKWANDNLFIDYTVILIDQDASKAKTFNEFFYYPDQETKKDICKELRADTEGYGFLFIFDCINDEQLPEDSVYQKIVDRQHFSKATLLHLRRSNNCRHNHNSRFDQHIRILGFTAESLNDYITTASSNDSKLLATLESCRSHPVFSPLMSIPAECAIITNLYCLHWKNGDEEFSPNTQTEVYTDLVRTLLLKYLDNIQEEPVVVKKFTDLPKVVGDQFFALAELAAKGIRDGVYVFDIAQDETLGLMQRVEKVYPGRKSSESYNFLNLTLQEYMAACYCSPKPAERLNDVFKSKSTNIIQSLLHCRNPCASFPQQYDHFNVVDFTFGLTKLSWDILLFSNYLKTSVFDGEALPLMYFLYEIQSPDLVCLTFLFQNNPASSVGKYGLLEIPYFRTPSDLFVIGYCIPHSNRSWLLNTTWSTFKCEYFEALAKGLDMSSDQCSSIGHIMVMKVNAEYVQWLPRLHPHTQKVTELSIQSKQGDHDLKTLSKVSLFYILC